MDLPTFQVPILGNGVVIGVNAIVHVLVSHGMAIGLMAMIVLAEIVAERRASAAWRRFARDLTKFTVVIVTGVGAVTGVGIWFTTSALAPRAIASLLRVFFWPWALEWLVFATELIVLLVYYFTWSRWGESPDPRLRRRHVRLGVAYVLLTCLGAAIISAILGFMLTPGRWPGDQRLVEAFLNPSYVPQLAYRLALSVHLGALLAAASCLTYHRDPVLRRAPLPFFGRIAGLSFLAVAASAFWYFTRVPIDPRDESLVAVLTSRLAQAPSLFWLGNGVAALAVVLFCALLVLGARRSATVLVAPALVAAIALASEFERIREFIRGPYLMPGYMYASQILVEELPLLRRRGLLSRDAWRRVRDAMPADAAGTAAEDDLAAAFLFAQNCSACHTIGGVNDIVTRLAGRPQDGIEVILDHTHDLVPFMPPFAGSDEERRLVAGFLHRLAAGEVEMSSLARFVPAPAGAFPAEAPR